MKKLFTFLSRANNNSVGISFYHRRVSSIYSMLTIVAIMLMVPYSMRGATTTIDFVPAASSKQYYPGRFSITQTDNYGSISGAKVGDKMTYRNQGGSGDLTLDISRLAFAWNGDAVIDGDGSGNNFYLYAERINNTWYRGLYTGSHATRLAILNLKPGDKVTFTYTASTHIHNNGGNDNWHANLQITNYNYWLSGTDYPNQPKTETVNISHVGDLTIAVNIGTIIQSITIESEVAEYDITTNGTTTTFEFTKNGTLEENDFALPYMSFSMGNIKDYLVVQGNNKEVHMYKPTGGEAMETNEWPNYIPITGSFYEFKPTGGGVVKMEGSLTGVVHLFVFDPKKNTWVEKQNEVFHKLNFPDTSNQNPQYGTDYYDENYSFTNNNGYVSFSFTVEKDKYYYVCIDKNNTTEVNNNYAFHMHKMSFTNSFHLAELAKVIDLENVNFTNVNGEDWIDLTAITGYGSADIHTKRCSGNINPLPKESYMIRDGFLYMKKPTFVEGTDNAGTVLIDVKTKGGNAVFVATFPYHADFGADPNDPTKTSIGHTWNFIDPRNSDTNIGNCWINDGWDSFTKGTTTGILSIGQDKNTNSQFHIEVQNREWTYSQRQTGQSGGFHDPYYVNVWDMVGDNADMIWETEGLWFDTGTNLSCINNESNPVVWDNEKEKNLQVGNPLNFAVPRLLEDDGVTLAGPIGYDEKGRALYKDPDRYVGLLPVTDDKKSSFTIPGLKDGDRVLIFMKSGEGSGANGIFLNITGAKDALGKKIETVDTNPDTWYRAGGTNWQHSRYEGCYHFIKDGDGNMTFDMQSGSMCKLLYIRIYTGQRISTNNIVSSTDDDSGKLLFMNDKGATEGSGSNMSLRFRGKGQQQKSRVLTSSGNLNYSTSELKKNDENIDSHFTVTGAYSQAVGFKSEVGEIGMFRMRQTDVEYSEQYVADFTDRNFTVGYRDKVDSYPYTWDFTDIQGFSSDKMDDEADDYPIAAAAQDEYGDQWDISLFDKNGNMKVNTGFDPEDYNQIFSPHKIGNGNQLWAGGDVIPEARGLWFYSEDDSDSDYTSDYSSSLYNDCLQITTDGIRFANTPDANGKRVAWWNYKMVVPDVPADGAVYMRMKRDTSVPDDAVTYSKKDNAYVPFLAARFKFASQGSKTDMVTGGEITNGESYSFFQVPGSTTDEWIVAVKNTTGSVNHLTFTLNGWIVEKVAVSTDYKKIGTTGYATESRARVIDQRLTSYFTGLPVKAYKGKMDSNYTKLTLTEIDIMDKDDDPNNPNDAPHLGKGCILYNSLGDKAETTGEGESTNEGETTNESTPDKSVKVLDNGFHLFVPDMHLKDEATTKNTTGYGSSYTISLSNNDLKACVPVLGVSSTGIGADGSTPVTRFILSAKPYRWDDASHTVINDGKVGFYRMDPNGVNMKGNQAYIEIPTGVIPELVSSTHNQGKVSIIFSDFFEDVNYGITTTIDNASQLNDQTINEGNEWYNLNGQKLNGKPTSSGLYIINGKKVLVK